MNCTRSVGLEFDCKKKAGPQNTGPHQAPQGTLRKRWLSHKAPARAGTRVHTHTHKHARSTQGLDVKKARRLLSRLNILPCY